MMEQKLKEVTDLIRQYAPSIVPEIDKLVPENRDKLVEYYIEIEKRYTRADKLGQLLHQQLLELSDVERSTREKQLQNEEIQAYIEPELALAADLFRDSTRRSKRNLMIAAGIGYLTTLGEIMPQKIDSFGLTFDSPQQITLISVIGAVIAYQFVSFALAGYRECRLWKKSVRNHYRERKATFANFVIATEYCLPLLAAAGAVVCCTVFVVR